MVSELLVAVVLSWHVIDGDTIDFKGHVEKTVWPGAVKGYIVEDRVRLLIVNTPEKRGTPCERMLAKQAQEFTQAQLSQGRKITIETHGQRDSFGRVLGYVRIDGRDLGQALLESQHARLYSKSKSPWC